MLVLTLCFFKKSIWTVVLFLERNDSQYWNTHLFSFNFKKTHPFRTGQIKLSLYNLHENAPFQMSWSSRLSRPSGGVRKLASTHKILCTHIHSHSPRKTTFHFFTLCPAIFQPPETLVRIERDNLPWTVLSPSFILLYYYIYYFI